MTHVLHVHTTAIHHIRSHKGRSTSCTPDGIHSTFRRSSEEQNHCPQSKRNNCQSFSVT